MGCGKSKHAVETASTVVKSTNSDDTKETHTTKTVTEKGDSSLVQKEVETKSVFVEDTKKETVTTRVDPSAVAKTENVAPTSTENVVKENEKVKDSSPVDAKVAPTSTENVVKENEKVKDSSPIDADVAPKTPENVAKAAKLVSDDEKVKDFSPRDVSDASTEVVEPTLTQHDAGDKKVAKDEEEKKESTVIADHKEKSNDVPDEPPTKDEEIKDSNLTKHNRSKTEFMTPTLSEDVVGALQVVKDDKEIKNSKEEKTESKIIDEKSVKTIDEASNPKSESAVVEVEKVIAPPPELKKVETKKEEDVDTTKTKVANADASLATEPTKVSNVSEANAVETQEKEPKTV